MSNVLFLDMMLSVTHSAEFVKNCHPVVLRYKYFSVCVLYFNSMFLTVWFTHLPKWTMNSSSFQDVFLFH